MLSTYSKTNKWYWIEIHIVNLTNSIVLIKLIIIILYLYKLLETLIIRSYISIKGQASIGNRLLIALDWAIKTITDQFIVAQGILEISH